MFFSGVLCALGSRGRVISDEWKLKKIIIIHKNLHASTKLAIVESLNQGQRVTRVQYGERIRHLTIA